MACSYDWSHGSWSTLRVSGEKEIVSGVGALEVDFLSFLAIVQALQIRFLSVSWDEARQDIGLGGTGLISQSLVNAQASFAFKRVREKYEWEDQILQILANEITVLSHNAIREHPNIVQLQGLSWDIHQSYDNKPWPVLIFEKSDFGDLYDFARSPIGRQMRINNRIKLCIDIGLAIMCMHANGIIHGDIKPHNVLVFQEESGGFCAKVTDFGYSTRYADKDYRVKLPRSPPWSAPEYRSNREWTHSQAVKLDVFSFGLLCFWLLFEPHLSEPKALAGDCDSGPGLDHTSTMQTLERVKENFQAETCARELLKAEGTLDDNRRRGLEGFFRLSLMENPQGREADLPCLLQMLDSRVSNRNAPSMETGYLPPVTEFQIEAYLHDLYRCDYRVRLHIFRRISEGSQRSSALAIQLALCYHIGFGVPRNEKKSAEILAQSKQGPHFMLEMISRIPGEADFRPAILLERLWHQGFLGTEGVRYSYLDRETLNGAEQQLLQEIRDLVAVLGNEDSLTVIVKKEVIELYCMQKRWKQAEELALEVLRVDKKFDEEDDPYVLGGMNRLAFIYNGQGRWKEAGDMEVQVYESAKRTLGEEHRYTLTSMGNLAQIYASQGRNTEAEELKLKEIKIRRKILGEDHRSTLVAMTNLASIYIGQDRLQEAEQLLTQTITAKERVLGPEHPSTLVSMGNLGALQGQRGHFDEADRLLSQTTESQVQVLGEGHPDTLSSKSNLAGVKRDRGQWEEAENLFGQVLETMKVVLGEQHPSTLIVMGNLASVHSKHGRWNEAKELEVHVMSTFEKILGEEHPHTLTIMNNLARTYNALGQLKEAGELEVRVLKISQKVLGEEHADTLVRLANLAGTRRDQGLWEEAERLELHVMEAMGRVLGEEHPSTITSMSNLASTYKKQGRWADAERLLVQVVKLRGRVLGKNHPDTKASMMSLVFMFVDQGRRAEAEELITNYDPGKPNADNSNDGSNTSEVESSDDDSLDAEGNSWRSRPKVPYRNPWLRPEN